MPKKKTTAVAAAALVPPAPVEHLIYQVRGQRMIIDSDLAFLYGVTTKRLNEQVRRNSERFPEDFMFQLTWEEAESLRSQIVTLTPPNKPQAEQSQSVTHEFLRSQIATLPEQVADREAIPKQMAHLRYRPFAFTEHGVVMAATVLNSPQAVKVSLFVVRAFVKLREMISAQRELAARIEELERKVGLKLQEHDGHIRNLFQVIRDLLKEENAPPKPPIGFQTELQGSRSARRLHAGKIGK